MALSTSSEPVLDAAKLASAVGGVVVSVGAVLVILGLVSEGDVQAIAQNASAIVVSLGAAVAFAMPIYRAVKAREFVTPVINPHNDAGEPLAPVVADDFGDGLGH